MDVTEMLVFFPGFRGFGRSFCPRTSAGISTWTSAGYPAPKLTQVSGYCQAATDRPCLPKPYYAAGSLMDSAIPTRRGGRIARPVSEYCSARVSRVGLSTKCNRTVLGQPPQPYSKPVRTVLGQRNSRCFHRKGASRSLQIPHRHTPPGLSPLLFWETPY